MKIGRLTWIIIGLSLVTQGALAQTGVDAMVESVEKEEEADFKTRELAQQLFLDGVAYFNQKRLEEAVLKFRAAYQIRPSWRLQYNIGQCEAGLKNYGRAIVAFEKYLGNGGDEVEVGRQDEVLRELDRLKRMVGKIVVEGPEGYVIWVDGEEAGNSPLVSGAVVTIGVVHEVVVRDATTNEEVNRFEVTVIGGETLRLNIAPREADGASGMAATRETASKQAETAEDDAALLPESGGAIDLSADAGSASDALQLNGNDTLSPVDGKRRRKLGPAFFIVSLSTTIAAGATTAVLLASINSKWEDAESSYQGNPWEYDDGEKQSIRNLQVASWVTGGLTVVGLAATVISIPLTNWHRSSSRRNAIRLSPFGTRTATGMVVSGSF